MGRTWKVLEEREEAGGEASASPRPRKPSRQEAAGRCDLAGAGWEDGLGRPGLSGRPAERLHGAVKAVMSEHAELQTRHGSDLLHVNCTPIKWMF